MVYPSAVQHRRGWLSLRYARLRAGLQGRRDTGVEPIPDPLPICFVVGCGNSGTTLLAARLGNHPAVFAVRTETNVFEARRPLAAARQKVVRWMAKARSAGARLVVEKTPKHVHAIARIRRILPEAKVIVVLRNPLDTCLSLSKRPKAKRWGGLEHAIERWLIDNAAALEWRGTPLVTLVRYEEMTERPEATFRRVLDFLGLPWDDAVLASAGSAFGGASQRTETIRLRAAQVREPIRPNSGKWRTELTETEVARIRERTADLWNAFGGDET